MAENGAIETPQHAPATAPGTQSRWRRRLVVCFVVLYISLQLVVPTLGLYARETGDRNSLPFSWHMFSRVPEASDAE